jgi:hypothetical protein
MSDVNSSYWMPASWSRRRPLLLGMLVAVLLGPTLLLTGVAQTTVAEVPSALLVASVPPVTLDPASIGTNPFIPEDANIGDCVSSAPRPECGSDEQGGWHQYLTMLVLLMGTVFIGWRIARGVRSRDRAMTPPTDA